MNIKPWHENAIPHEDVSAGRYQQAEFAADLAQVMHGKADAEYQDPIEFFSRTYLTEGMGRLLVSTIQRVTGKGGEPVVKLKTSFGGGKTHTMLALYHLFGGIDPKRLHGMSELLDKTASPKIPKCRIAVLVGTALDPSKPHKSSYLRKGNIRTLWGEMAVQIGGKDKAEEAYILVKDADEKGVAPGSDTMVELFDRYGPCIVLIDELVAYSRNIYHVHNTPAGSFDSNMTFVQNLTEAARRSKNSLVVASIPESNIEIGGEGGLAALERLEHTFGRLESVWQPVGQLESFEIVRRRVFSRIASEKDRDEVCSAYHRLYREQSQDFPTKCKEREYLERLKAAYPVHPEFFDRLYEDWATLEKFQRTRGVLRLMAAVVHELWTKNDQSSLIMPCSLPLYSPKVRDELTRYLGDPWGIIVDKDVDGDQSEPSRIDRDNPRIGSAMAARRVARTIFLGSAPSVRQQNVRGVEETRIRLGVAQPGENLAVFTDALGRLTDKLTYLYHDNKRYWYDTRPNLRRTVEDRAVQWDQHDVEAELIRRLQRLNDRHSFTAVHVTSEPSDIPDEQEARLVVLGPRDVHRRDTEMPAQSRAQQILDSKGTGPRIYKNTLMFLAPDAHAVQNCMQEIRRYLAWNSVIADEEKLALDAAQEKQAREQSKKSNDTVDARIVEAYCWLIVPHQEISPEEGPKSIEWQTSRLSGSQGGPIARASQKAVKDQQLITQWSPMLLKMELDRLLWKDVDSISIKRLWDYMTTYLYLPRLKDESVLVETIHSGLKSGDFFAYANGQNGAGRYMGLAYREDTSLFTPDGTNLLVKPEIAVKQIESEMKVPPTKPPKITEAVAISGQEPKQTMLQKLTRFHGSVTLNPERVARDAGEVASSVIAHLVSIPDSEVQVHMEIEAKIPGGAPEKTVRTVTENAKTLKFKDHGFEEG
jgi:hypothetical protein